MAIAKSASMARMPAVTVFDCAIAADDCYGANPMCSEGGWIIADPKKWGAGFAASTFRRGTQVIIAFRGTDDQEDALADAEMLPAVGVVASWDAVNLLLKKYNVGDEKTPKWVPAAVVGAIQLARTYGENKGVTNRVPKEQRRLALKYYAATKPAPSFVVGHSLGGALAQIVGLERKVAAVSFNSPFIGGIHGDVPMSTLTLLHVNADLDPVSMLTKAAGSLPHGGVKNVRLPPCPEIPPKAGLGSLDLPMWAPFFAQVVTAPERARYIGSLVAYLERAAIYYHSMANLRAALGRLDWATKTPIDATFSRIVF